MFGLCFVELQLRGLGETGELVPEEFVFLGEWV
jgi:hypothetical protein